MEDGSVGGIEGGMEGGAGESDPRRESGPAAEPGRLDDQDVTRARKMLIGAGASDAPALVKLSDDEALCAGGSWPSGIGLLFASSRL